MGCRHILLQRITRDFLKVLRSNTFKKSLGLGLVAKRLEKARADRLTEKLRQLGVESADLENLDDSQR